MRRISRIRHPAGLLAATATATATANALMLRFPHATASAPTPSTTHHISTTPPAAVKLGRFGRAPPPSEPTPATPPQASTQPELSPEESAEIDGLVANQYPAEPSVPLPPRRRIFAQRQAEVDDPSYVPAESAEGLPEVKSTDDWFQDDANWDARSQFYGFAPAADNRVQDLRVLEVLLRRATAEALIWQKEGRNMAASWPVGGRQELIQALGLEVRLDDKGDVRVGGDTSAVFKALDDVNDPEEERKEEEEEEDDDVDEPPADIETASRSDATNFTPFLEGDEAGEMLKGWDKSWRNIKLHDIGLKFSIVKRIYQLTGHRIHDYKLHSVLTVGGLLKVLQTKPKPTKLIEILDEKPELTSLPNVKVYERRVTPIDKEKMVGRWKVIEHELEKRGLPVTGHEHLPRSNRKNWLRGKP